MASHIGFAIAIAFSLAGCAVETSGLGGMDGAASGRDASASADTGIGPVVDAAGRDATPALDAGPLDAGPPDAGPPDAGPPDTGPVCPGGGAPMPETCNGVDDDCDGVRDEDESALCAGSTSCLRWDGRFYCMSLACPSDPCCSGTGTNPCMSPFSCEHVRFDASDCPPECAGQCGNCHMCVRL